MRSFREGLVCICEGQDCKNLTLVLRLGILPFLSLQACHKATGPLVRQ